VSGDDRELRRVDLAVAQVQVGAADGACLDAEEQLPRRRLRVGQLDQRERLSGSCENRRLHAPIIP
jgi:hypothetical protein